MQMTADIKIKPEELERAELVEQYIRQALPGLRPGPFDKFLLRRSIDARGREPLYILRYLVSQDEPLPAAEPSLMSGIAPVHDKPAVLIVGAGPAGYFAALELICLGYRPIVLERGKDVRLRRRDLRAIQQEGIVDPHSNYCFGEGGAGTYSDGKLYTRSTKRGDVPRVLRLFVEHGAPTDILIDAHPHIGTNKLPVIVQNMRRTIEHYGGAVHFGEFVSDFLIRDGRMKGVVTDKGHVWEAGSVILATGHSARDIYRLLQQKGIFIEAKPFALGVRVEHPQDIVDGAQYNRSPRGPYLPAASYSLTCQVSGRGVFSFCMCPGGMVVPAATMPGEIVVNGMSPSRRDSPYANSGIVTSVELSDLGTYNSAGPLAAMNFQGDIEQAMYKAGDGSQRAPALRLTDYLSGRISQDLPDSSYIPGLFAAPLHEMLPGFIHERLRAGLRQFSKTMKGYYTAEAVVVGTESRTSAPVRIPRDPLSCMHPQVQGLFPCGEGAGYAGGIVSAAMDGIRVARAIGQIS